ncbi:NAD kinase [Thermonema rossianum]|jgi:NAD+ kinase|uniref:NAD kinase n=1 Tax=Thermonema rossianum TaxID=55505 RepID=UPI00056F2364|nr:NAD kinase [Thermonema rossianum]
MVIAIHGRNFRAEVRHYIERMLHILVHQYHAKLFFSKDFARLIQKHELQAYDGQLYYTNHSDLPEVDFFFSVGGDGTMLESVTHVGARQIPIVGINTGRLGFLATIAPHELEDAVHNLYNGYYHFDDRSLIHLDSNCQLFGELNFALNEFTVTKRDTASMIIVHAYVDGEYLNSYWADGLIISTPTGSTGYSLSCGGPIVFPRSKNFIITPVSPHNLSVRPLIISDQSVISLQVEGRSRYFLASLDSRSEIIDSSVQIAISKERFCARLVQMKEHSFMETLRNKLNWGLDVRN